MGYFWPAGNTNNEDSHQDTEVYWEAYLWAAIETYWETSQQYAGETHWRLHTTGCPAQLHLLERKQHIRCKKGREAPSFCSASSVLSISLTLCQILKERCLQDPTSVAQSCAKKSRCGAKLSSNKLTDTCRFCLTNLFPSCGQTAWKVESYLKNNLLKKKKKIYWFDLRPHCYRPKNTQIPWNTSTITTSSNSNNSYYF